jgi:hypothetical protein
MTVNDRWSLVSTNNFCELCAAVNIIAVNKINQTEIVENKENVHSNANEKKSVEIDLKKEMIESSTTIESVAAEPDFINNAEPVNIAEPVDTANLINTAELVNTGDSYEKIDSLNQYTINLCQTVSCNDTTLNIGYDSGATVTLVSEKVAKMNIEEKNIDYVLDTIGGRNSLRGSGAVRILLAMKGGGMHVLNALVTDKPLGKVAALPPPHTDVEQVLAVPKEELADRRGGAIDILMGRDNSHFFPQDLDSPQGTDSGMRLFRAVLDKGVMYAGSVKSVPKNVAPPVSMKSKMLAKSSLLSLSMLLMTGFNVLAPASGFVAYDCMNASNTVEAYSLLAPEECHMTGGEHKVKRIVQAEVVQIKRERTINVFRCQVLETLVSHYCGHSSAAGVTRYLKFREPLLVEANSCRKALTEDGNITIANRNFRARIGTTTSHSFFVAGDLDDGHHCQTGSVSIGNKVLEYQATQTILEVTLMEEFAKVNDVHGLIRLPGGIQAKVANQTISDSLVGTIVWRHRPTSCPGGLTQLFRGNLKIYANNTSSFLGSVAILQEKGQVAGLKLQSSLLLCHHPAFRTHLKDVLVVIHPDNVSSIVGDPFDAEQVSDFIRIESELSFLHVKTTLSQRDKLRQVGHLRDQKTSCCD